MNVFFKVICVSVISFGISACATNTAVQEAQSKEGQSTQTKTTLAEQTADVTEWRSATVKVADGTEKVCKRTQQTGTRFKKKICLTQEQWDGMADASKRSASEVQRRSGTQSNPGGG